MPFEIEPLSCRVRNNHNDVNANNRDNIVKRWKRGIVQWRYEFNGWKSISIVYFHSKVIIEASECDFYGFLARWLYISSFSKTKHSILVRVLFPYGIY